MAFRDDRDALRAKNEVLESELEDRDSELARVQEALAKHEAKDEVDEEQLATLRAEVARLKRRLGEDPGPDAPAAQRRWLGAAIMLALVALVGAGIVNALVVHRADTERRRAELEAEARAAAMEVEAAHEEARRAEAEAARAAMLEEEARRAAEAARDAAEAARRNAEARRVAEAEARADADDRAPLTFPTAQPEVRLAVVTHVAGSAPLAEGRGCALVKMPGATSGTLECGALSLRAGSGTTFAEHEGSLIVQRRRGPRFVLRLRLEDEVLGARRLLSRIPLRVERTAGEPPHELAGRSCELVLRGVTSCQAWLRCGEELLYGGPQTGWAGCRTDRERRPETFEDDRPSPDDGDAILEWSGDVVRLADVGWAVELRRRALAASPMSFRGRFVGEGGAEVALRIAPSTANALDLDAGEGVRVDIFHGSVVIHWADHVLRGHFGPAFATLAGHDESGRAFTLFVEGGETGNAENSLGP